MRHLASNFHKCLFFIILSLVGGFYSSAQSCPTLDTDNATQEFCDADTPRIRDLMATDGGDGIAWYANSMGGTPLTENIILQDGTTYYAGNSLGNCGARLSVLVNILGKPPTDVDVAISRCSADINTIAQLSADGTNIEWYTERTNGTLLSLGTPLVNGEVYWVQQTEGGCTSIRLPTSVTIIDPGEPTGDAEQFFCFDPSNPITFFIADLEATGTDINWYNSLTSNSPLDPSTPLQNNETYFATQTTFPCESTERFATTVKIQNQPNAGTPISLGLCDSQSNNINLLDELGGDNGGTWSGPITTTNGDLGTLNPSLLDPGTFVFTYTIATLNQCSEVTSTVTVNIQEEPDAGQDNILEICASAPNVDLFTLLGEAPDTGGTWSPTLASGTGVYDPMVDPPGVYSYTVSPTAPCNVSDSATITVNVAETPFAGNDVATSICATDAPVDLFTLLVGADTDGVWSPVLNSGTGIFDPTIDIAGSYTYTVAASATCPGDESIVTVSIIETPEAGDDNSIYLCSNDDPVDLFTIIGGTPDTNGFWSPALASTTGVFNPVVDTAGVYTYTVSSNAPCTTADTASITVNIQQAPDAGLDGSATLCINEAATDLFMLLRGSPDTGGTWSPALSSGPGIFDPAADPAGTYTYTIPQTAVCASVSAAVTITLLEQPFAGNNAAIDLCTNSETVDLFTILGGTPNAGGTWSPSMASGNGVFNPSVDTAGTYTYTLEGFGICESDSATVTVNVNTAPVTGTDSAITVCANDVFFDLFPLLGPGVDTNGTWSGPSTVTNGNTGTFDPFTNTPGIYTYSIAGTGNCNDSSASVTVTIMNPEPTLVNNGQIFCSANRPLVSDLINNIVPDSSNGTIQVYPTATETSAIAATEVLVNGTTYYVTETDLISGCETTNRLTVTVQVNDPQAPVLSTSAAEFCLVDAPIVGDLNSFIDMGNNIIWFDAPSDGNQLNDTDTLVNGSYYAIEEDVNGCQSIVSNEINIIINDVAPPSLNAGGNALCGAEMPSLETLETNLNTDFSVVWYETADSSLALNSTDLLLDNTTYYAATVNEVTGCESSQRLEIEVDLTNCDPDQFPLLLPDGFSPNGDGINDTYSLENVQFLYEDYTIEIYNRYGNLVYIGDNSTRSWDGTSNQGGALGDGVLPNGVYFYIFNYNRDNVQPVQGRIYLNR